MPRRREVDVSTSATDSALHDARVTRLYLTRGVIAIVWGVVVMMVAGSDKTVSGGTGVLLVLYPVIDVVGCLIDARGQEGSARQLLLVNAAVSVVAAVALGVAATGTVANVLVVFGVWALLSGAAQLVVALRRRAQLGNQWPVLIAGAGSVIWGAVFLVLATTDRPDLRMVAVYAIGGGLEFVIQAWLVARRRHRFSGMRAPSPSAS
jgi:uncharacterized membrane protein HdeD (DUF308 family)